MCSLKNIVMEKGECCLLNESAQKLVHVFRYIKEILFHWIVCATDIYNIRKVKSVLVVVVVTVMIEMCLKTKRKL